MMAAQLKMATALYRIGDSDSARVVFERVNAIAPDQQAEWYLSKIALNEDRDSDALEHLVKSARLCDVTTKSDDRKVVMYALKELATRMGRADVLKEFDDRSK